MSIEKLKNAVIEANKKGFMIYLDYELSDFFREHRVTITANFYFKFLVINEIDSDCIAPDYAIGETLEDRIEYAINWINQHLTAIQQLPNPYNGTRCEQVKAAVL